MARKKTKTEEEFLRDWLRQKLRRLSFQWPPIKEAMRKARVSRGKYKCAMCEEDGIDKLYGPREVVRDHINPVINVEDGFVDWNSYIRSLFCPVDGIQILCHDHHDTKTFWENQIRKEVNLEKKQFKKKDEEDI